MRRAFFSCLHFDRAAGVHVDDRLVAQQDAVRPDLDGIIGRVHKVIEVLDPPGRQGPQRNRWESCVDADVMMQLMGIPPSAVSTCSLYPIQEVVWPLALRLLPTSQALQVCQHLRKAHRQLPFQPARLLRPRLSLAWPPPLATLRLRCLRLRRRLLPRLDRRRIPRDVLDKMAIHRPRNQRLMQTVRKTALGKLGKGPRKRRLARSRPAPLQPHSRHSLPSTSRRSIRPRVVGMSNTALAMKARASAARPPPDALPGRGSRAEEPRAPVPEPRRTLVALAHRAKLAFEPRE